MFTVFNQELMFCQVNNLTHQLSAEEFKHCKSSFVKLVRLEDERRRKRRCSKRILKNTINRWGLRFRREYLGRFKKGRCIKTSKQVQYHEIVIDNKVLEIRLLPNCFNLRLLRSDNPVRIPLPVIPQEEINHIRMLNNSTLDSSLLKQNKANGCGTPKSVSFNNTFIATPISPRLPPTKDYESMYKEYLKSVQVNNGVRSTPISTTPMNTKDDDDDEEEYMPMEVLDDDPPKRKRGRPRGSGRRYDSPPYRPLPPSPPKKRGWPLGLPRKEYTDIQYLNPVTTFESAIPRGRRGRPRKFAQFGFQTIVSDIKTVSLPSDLWSAHVSVTAKQSQVCFTRVVQAISNTVPVECDRSVKFNGAVEYLVRINNREVELVAAPETVGCLRDVEILLDIVNEIDINDPVLEYFDR